MTEIDLIPAAYRRRGTLRRWLRGSGVLLLLLSLLLIGSSATLRMHAERLEDEVARLQQQKAISAQQRQDLERLNARKTELRQQLDLLAGLRGGAAADRMFVTVDRAIRPGRVWFTDWRFRRAGTKTDRDPDTVDTGYFIVVKRGQPGKKEAWMIETEMKIDGEALDHAALSEFVSNLVDQPEIQSVRVVRTETIRLNDRPLVRFSLDILVASAGGATS
ncbi:MAG: hypothetical protein QNJ91_08285 [Gammaproteobacteria bacterium]|nr:hypothetical protein [Gammaproteobacteria bacterium]